MLLSTSASFLKGKKHNPRNLSRLEGWPIAGLAILVVIAVAVGFKVVSDSGNTPTRQNAPVVQQPADSSDSTLTEPDTPAAEQTSAGSGNTHPIQGVSSVEQQANVLIEQRRYSEAIPLLDQACKAGGANEACVDLGNLYRDGVGAAVDKSRAENLFQKVCAMGDQEGCYQLKDLLALDALKARDAEDAPN